MDDKEFVDRQMLLIDDNVNVGKTSDGKEFLILVGGLVGVILLIIMFADVFANIFINIMPDKTQVKIERMFGELPSDKVYNNKYLKQMNTLQKVRKEIISHDENLWGKSSFPIIFTQSEHVNAWVIPNGTIYFTTTLLDKNFTDEELTFVLAHEIGHYSHRDHLRTISRQIIIATVCSIFTYSQGSDMSSLVQNVTQFESLSHSRMQERNADLYANKMLISIYGTNRGGVQFFEYLQKEDKAPEFLDYFMTHPAPAKRLRLINK